MDFVLFILSNRSNPGQNGDVTHLQLDYAVSGSESYIRMLPMGTALSDEFRKWISVPWQFRGRPDAGGGVVTPAPLIETKLVS